MLNIIIPIYKSKNTLPKALDSLVAQTKQLFMVTLVNDCDGENYDEIIKEYSRRGLHINYLEMEENKGPGEARQKGIDASAQFDYLIFLDADDMLQPRAVETLYSEAKKNNADVLSSDIIREDKANTVILEAAKSPVTWIHGKIYRRQFLIDNNIRFLEGIRYNEDSYFNLVCFNSTKNKGRLDEPLSIWRRNEGSLTSDVKNFLEKGNDQYIYGQIKALEKIYEIRGEIPKGCLTSTIINIYSSDQQQQYYEYSRELYFEELKRLINTIYIKDFLSDAENWINIINELKAGIVQEDQIIFYETSFSEWIMELQE